MTKHELIVEPEGYLSLKNKPTKSELEAYYRNKYYQESKGAYEACYSPEEVKWKKSVEEVTILALKDIVQVKTFLDIGCGEGFLVSAMLEKGADAYGIDFGLEGVKQHNSEIIHRTKACDIYEYIEKEDLSRFDCVSIMHVIEHVLDPRKLISMLKEKMKPETILIVRHPNDNSILHKYAKSRGKFKEDFFIEVPDHLSYFNVENMEVFLKEQQLDVIKKFSSWPVDLAILNDDTNYAKDPSKGKSVHNARVLTHNLLFESSNSNYLKLLVDFAELGIGRDITFICRV
ncbi:class I SAM-dependent methyltransferase [Vibrio brasiliensis]|uniref:class I SAM-dependent methyltransferase n=1 Tax=Vibrio brasiliensis TaxID=170652 RepID=UPI001EFE7776|nr:class I SAM-dependent methyltransferase [Vibrio brasiliensis]MCG9752991.1 class I SAM-dependent methyltransferase [Vibrio brasiliensis]